MCVCVWGGGRGGDADSYIVTSSSLLKIYVAAVTSTINQFRYRSMGILISTLSNISNTRRRVSSGIQILKSRLKKRGAAELFFFFFFFFFFLMISRCLDIR